MSEIEYRLEQTPPVIEIPEDNIYEDVEAGKEVPPNRSHLLLYLLYRFSGLTY